MTLNFKVSPDAFTQLTLQLAHFRMHKKFVLTYEAAMTLLFKVRKKTLQAIFILQAIYYIAGHI